MVKDMCFLYKRSWKNTLNMSFLSQKLHDYRCCEQFVELQLWDGGEAATEEVKKSYHVLRKIE
ncbi:hypothetical protein GLYMA_09G114850v4 [Glycine max]|nr:hypothetical protein GLYMA_09G114850v4 [Glycine max]KAH1042569.1 hypothetical protein GYH30_024735 [Glycine max]